MDNQEKLVEHLGMVLKDKFGIEITGDFGMEITDGYEGDKYIGITEPNSSITYDDWEYVDFTFDKLKIWASAPDKFEMDVDMKIQEEYIQLRSLVMDGLNSFDICSLNSGQVPVEVNGILDTMKDLEWEIKTGKEQVFGSCADIYAESDGCFMMIDDGNVEILNTVYHVYSSIGTMNDKIFEGYIDEVSDFKIVMKVLGFIKS